MQGSAKIKEEAFDIYPEEPTVALPLAKVGKKQVCSRAPLIKGWAMLHASC